MMYAILMFALFLVSTLFVVVLVGAVVWGGVRQVVKRSKGKVLEALDLVEVGRI